MSLAIRDVVGIHKDGFDFRFAAKDGTTMTARASLSARPFR